MSSKSEGFTLIELMLVVALIGILSAIATANYQKYVGRARQAEAKIALSAAYAAETGFFAENGSYTHCLTQAGYAPSTGSKRYYFVGYMAAPGLLCGPSGTGKCWAYAWNPDVICNVSCATFGNTGIDDASFGATVKANPAAVVINTCPNQNAAALPNTWTAVQGSFIVGAAGNINSNAPTYDKWQIDDKKSLIQINSGL